MFTFAFVSFAFDQHSNFFFVFRFCFPEKINFGKSESEDSMTMEQEEEWEREGLLDPAWEKQQRKVKKIKSKNYLILDWNDT